MLIQEIIWILRRWLWLLILGILVGGFFAYWSSSRTVPIYQADAGVVVIRDNADVILEPRFVTVTDDSLMSVDRSDDAVQTLASMVINEAVVEPVYREIEAQLPGSVRDTSALIGAVNGEVRDGVIRVIATARNPFLAAAIANEWAVAYADYVNRIYAGKSVVKNLDTEVEAAKGRYEAAEEALNANTREDQTDEISSAIAEKKVLLDRMLTLRADTVAGLLERTYEQRQQTMKLLADARLLQDLMRDDPSQAASAANTLSLLYLQIAAVPVAQQDLVINFVPKNLEDFSVNSSELRTDLTALIKVLEDRLGSYDKQIEDLRQQVESAPGVQDDPLAQLLFSELDALRAEAAEVTAKRNELARQRDLLLVSYTLLANESEEIGIKNSAIDGTVVRFAIPASVPQSPINTSSRQSVVLGMFAGLIVAIAVAFVLELLDNKVRRPGDVEHFLALPTLASGPRNDPDKGGKPTALVDPTAPFVESMRYLRTALNSVPEKSHSLLITSVVPGDGKSSVASNLAVVLAQSDQVVVLVDANFRHPRLHQLFDVSQSKGVTNLLSDTTVSPTSVLQSTTIPRLKILSSGPIGSVSPDQLASQRMDDIMMQLGANVDVVIVDSAAAGEVTDAIVLATKVDTTVLVLRSGSTSVDDALRLCDAITAAGGDIIGVFLNGLRDARIAKWFSRSRRSGDQGGGSSVIAAADQRLIPGDSTAK